MIRPPMGGIVFCVNPHSGGGDGPWLREALVRRFPVEDVIDFTAGDAESALAKRLPGAERVVACGGDGTAASVLAALERRKASDLPLAVLPLGTGNDLARVLGWRPVGTGEDALDRFLARLAAATPLSHDAWRLRGPGIDRAWHNYWSCGTDAAIALGFDRIRRRHEGWFTSPTVNRAVYGLVGCGKRTVGLRRDLRGDDLILPDWCEVLVASNIGSYAGGVNLDPRIDPADGRCDLHAVANGLPLAWVLAGLRRPRRLARRDYLELRNGRRLVMQCDGEAFHARPGTYTIHLHGRSRLLMAGPYRAS